MLFFLACWSSELPVCAQVAGVVFQVPAGVLDGRSGKRALYCSPSYGRITEPFCMAEHEITEVSTCVNRIHLGTKGAPSVENITWYRALECQCVESQ